jgi:pimeloyl-ACP methyl ester carboxylesterase
METSKSNVSIGRVVAGSLISGILGALALVAGPLGGAEEHVITGGAMIGIAFGWMLLAVLSRRWTGQPQTWAALLAGYFGLIGTGLILLTPDGSTIDRLGWVWPPVFLALIAWMTVASRRSLRSRTRIWLVYPMFGVYALTAIGAGYQTVREYQHRLVRQDAGSLFDVGGHRLYLSCIGAGSPAAVLESGLGETSSGWSVIAHELARSTRVCVYDRAGRGASEPAPAPQDGAAVATDLHTALSLAQVAGPFVLVGHSTGGGYVRIFAGRYPKDVAGVVLLDAQPAEAFTRLPDFPGFYRWFRIASGLFPSLAQVGVGRLFFDADHASARHWRSVRNEFAALPATLAQAQLVQSLGDRPMMVVTAVRESQAGWLPLQDELATLSTNSIHRVLQDASHSSLLEDRQDAAESIQAILDVINCVRRVERTLR